MDGRVGAMLPCLWFKLHCGSETTHTLGARAGRDHGAWLLAPDSVGQFGDGVLSTASCWEVWPPQDSTLGLFLPPGQEQPQFHTEKKELDSHWHRSHSPPWPQTPMCSFTSDPSLNLSCSQTSRNSGRRGWRRLGSQRWVEPALLAGSKGTTFPAPAQVSAGILRAVLFPTGAAHVSASVHRRCSTWGLIWPIASKFLVWGGDEGSQVADSEP